MPIVDVAIVVAHEVPLRSDLAQELADACAAALNEAPGRLWVRLERLSSERYAENGCQLAADELPVFVTVLHGTVPVGPTLKAEIDTLTSAVARVTARPASRVHIEYAPSARGRLSFGGRLVE